MAKKILPVKLPATGGRGRGGETIMAALKEKVCIRCGMASHGRGGVKPSDAT